MEQIHLPKTLECEYSDDEGVQIRAEHSDEMERVFDVMHWNVKEVLISTLGIERHMKDSLDFYFYSTERDLFRSAILESDFMGFASTLKTMKAIQEQETLLESKDWKSLESELRKTMRYRNMLAHGKYSAFRENGVIKIKVNYFEGQSQSMVFDDVRWAKVQHSIREANQLTGQFMSKCFKHHAARLRKAT